MPYLGHHDDNKVLLFDLVGLDRLVIFENFPCKNTRAKRMIDEVVTLSQISLLCRRVAEVELLYVPAVSGQVKLYRRSGGTK